MKIVSLVTLGAVAGLLAGEPPSPKSIPVEVTEVIKQSGKKFLPAPPPTGLESTPLPPRDIAEAARAYATYRQMLPEPKSIGAELTTLCDGSPMAALRKLNGPHAGYYVQHFRNPIAAEAKDGKTWPEGSILIKQKLWLAQGAVANAKPEIRGVAGMIKRAPGTYPKSGDWEFFWAEDEKIKTTKMESCAGCHSGAAKDFVFTSFPGRTAKP